jgi:hypothetical protein
VRPAGGAGSGWCPVTTPRAAARAAKLLVETHDCVDCRALPPRPFDPADVEEDVEYRPKKPLATVSGGPRSRRCHRHTHAAKRATSLTSRTRHKAKTYGIPRPLQVELWAFQGSACPCGRKRSKEIPAGVTLDHEHNAPCIVRGDHAEKQGCIECVTGFVCAHCNTEIIGRLEGSFRKLDDPRAAVVAALAGLHTHVTDPPLRRLLAARPDLLEEAS